MSDSKKEHGVFLIKGMNVGVEGGELVYHIRPDGTPELQPVALSIRVDLYPYWFSTALTRLSETREAFLNLRSAHELGDDEDKAEALLREAIAGMQAIVAATTAMDAIYVSVRQRTDLDERTLAAWKENRTARHRQAFETFRRAFKVQGKNADLLRVKLKELAYYRDRIVHPPTKSGSAVRYPELEFATDWRLVEFRYRNALAIVFNCLDISALLAKQEHQSQNGEVKVFSMELGEKLRPLIEEFKSNFSLSDFN